MTNSRLTAKITSSERKYQGTGTCWDRNLDEAVQGMAQKRGDEILFSSMSLLLLFTDHGFDSGNITLGLDELLGVIQLIRRVLHAQHKQIFLQGVELGVQLCDAHGTNFTCLHLIHLLPGSRPRA